MGHAEQPVAWSLPSELWAKVFACMEATPPNIKVWVDKDETQHQAEVHQLKLVCKQFKQIYASHTELVQTLYLGWRVLDADIPPSTLLAWAQKNTSTVQTFRSFAWNNVPYSSRPGSACIT